MSLRFHLQGDIKSNIHGYESLSSVYQKIILSKEKDIVLYFDDAFSFDVNLAAVLGAMVYYTETKGVVCSIEGFDDKTKQMLIDNGFYSTGTISSIKSSEPYVSYRQFRLDDNDSFKKYVENELLNKDSFPKQSEGLKKEMVKNIFEIFENANHGECSHIFTCGHHYPKIENKRSRLDFTMVDVGRTFFENINDYMVRQKKTPMETAHEAIDWAVEQGNTTKLETGGLGLGLLLEFLGLNKGRMQIVSDEGYWEYDGETNQKNIYEKSIYSKFPGTIVNIEFNLDDTNSYSLVSEKKSFTGIF